MTCSPYPKAISASAFYRDKRRSEKEGAMMSEDFFG
jgi:hypothetical protein